jgi:hypothetical protein
VGKSQSLFGELVDALGVGAAQHAAAEASKLAKAEVIDMKVNDIRSASHNVPRNRYRVVGFGWVVA